MADTASTFTSPDPSVWRAAVELAVRAPSVHNTQPWRWRIRTGRLELHADRSRQLEVIDPSGRALLVSCGSALVQARIALEVTGYTVTVTRGPDHADPDHLATIEATGQAEVSPETRRLADAAVRRRTDRRPFADRPLDVDAAETLREAAAAEAAMLQEIRRPDDRTELIVAVGRADELEATDAAYLAEMREWTGRSADATEGVPASAVPHMEGRRSDVEIRDFEVNAPGTLDVPHHGNVERAAMFLLATEGDGAVDQLRAGEALGRVLLTATELGLSVSPYTQPMEVPGTAALLHRVLGGFGSPQIVLRVGWPGPGDEPPLTPRRPLDDVIDQP
jgi:nitroreductase